MLKKLSIFLLISFLFLTGCEDNISNNHSEENTDIRAMPAFRSSEDLDGVLAGAGHFKFNETVTPEMLEDITVVGYANLSSLYKPYALRDGMEISFIRVVAANSINFVYYDDIGERVLFSWSRHLPHENAVTSNFGRGAMEELIEVHNGITYGIAKWYDPEDDTISYSVSWAQYGEPFRMSFSPGFTKDEILQYCYAVPVYSWELDGNAMSVSIQGVDDISIYENPSNSIRPFGSTEDEIIAIGDVLHRASNMEIVGYRWLINDSTSRYQYVLEPGTYEFLAEGISGDPELLIQYFEAGEVESVVDLTSALNNPDVDGFTLTVSPDGVEDFTAGDDDDDGGSGYVPITSLRIDATVAVPVERGNVYRFGVILNDGASDEDIVWSVSDSSFALVDGWDIHILNKTGMIRLIATDPVSGLFHSIQLRIAS